MISIDTSVIDQPDSEKRFCEDVGGDWWQYNATSAMCCGDDKNEYYLNGTDGSKACCDNRDRKVIGGVCENLPEEPTVPRLGSDHTITFKLQGWYLIPIVRGGLRASDLLHRINANELFGSSKIVYTSLPDQSRLQLYDLTNDSSEDYMLEVGKSYLVHAPWGKNAWPWVKVPGPSLDHVNYTLYSEKPDSSSKGNFISLPYVPQSINTTQKLRELIDASGIKIREGDNGRRLRDEETITPMRGYIVVVNTTISFTLTPSGITIIDG